MDKAQLRQHFLERRLKISRVGYWTLTEEIIGQVKLIDWKTIGTAHVFLPIRQRNEVDTFSILNYFKLEQPQLRIVVPRTDFDNLSISNVLYDHEHTILRRNKYDIPEPIHGKLVPSREIDVVFTPLLVCDKSGNRVGYGKGFYDRFLSECRPDVKKIGLSFFEPIDEITDVNEFDIPLNFCLTPDKTWIFDATANKAVKTSGDF